MNPDRLFPYLLPGLLDPAWEAICVPLGHGVWVQLFEDTDAPGGYVHTAVGPDALRAAGLAPAAAHARAVANLDRFAEADPNLSIQMLGNPGDPVHFLLYSDHPRAAACLLLPDLYEEACDHLKTTEVVAVVPQRESLVVLPKRDRAYREMIVAKLRELEADAKRPIGFGLYELTPAGVRPFAE